MHLASELEPSAREFAAAEPFHGLAESWRGGLCVVLVRNSWFSQSAFRLRPLPARRGILLVHFERKVILREFLSKDPPPESSVFD